ncbi:MAG TPA: hypothetical protein VFM54_07415, partial [Micromonosporaceae bacterium]|nr:hypothetical protein [Micromonosporaceae bacterium]
MNEHRSYPAEPEPRWFTGEGNYRDSEWEARGAGAERYAEEGYRYATAPAGASPVGPRSGQPLPPPPDSGRDSMAPAPGALSGSVPFNQGGEDQHRFQTEAIDRNALRRGGGAAPGSDGIYRTRRPTIAVPLAVAAVLLALPAGRLLLSSAFGSTVSAAGVISAIFTLIGLPMVAAGLYGLLTGALRVPEAPGVAAWLRTPMAYLPIGLVLFVAAGLAAG